MAYRPFRITHVDDVLFEKAADTGGLPGVAKGFVFNRLKKYENQTEHPVELTLAGDLKFKLPCLQVEGGSFSPRRDWSEDVLATTDVLLLDLQGVPVRSSLEVRREDVERVPELPDDPPAEDIDKLNANFGGAAFLIANRNGLLRSCQHVIILTGKEDKGIVEKYVHPLCSDTPEGDVPWATMVDLGDRTDLKRTTERIETLHQTFTEGFTRITDQGAIELAAAHDDPVLIVGETGTGKEYVSQSIHRRWAQEKFRQGEFEVGRNEERGPTRVPFVTINCSLLDPDLGRTELFGAVRGSYTGLDRHRLGAVLEAAGITPDIPMDRASRPTEERRSYREWLRTSGLLEPESANSPNLVFRNRRTHIHGVLFLDELGDLPPQSQGQLLRLLQNREVSPLGYPGAIKNVPVRIIAATNDPRVASLAGHHLRYGLPREDRDAVFRGDLVSRLSGQVIKTTPITKENARHWVEHFVDAASGADWTNEAKNFFVGALESHIDHLHDSKDRDGQTPFFANRREIQQVVDRAATYVDTARQRGLRSVGDKVTEAVVKRVWNPSSIDLPKTMRAAAGSPPTDGGSRKVEAPDDIGTPTDPEPTHDQKQAVELYAAVETFLDEKGVPIGEWRAPDEPSVTGIGEKAPKDAWKDLKNHLEEVEDASIAYQLWVELVRKKYDKSQREAAFGVKRSTVSRYFNGHKPDSGEG